MVAAGSAGTAVKLISRGRPALRNFHLLAALGRVGHFIDHIANRATPDNTGLDVLPQCIRTCGHSHPRPRLIADNRGFTDDADHVRERASIVRIQQRDAGCLAHILGCDGQAMTADQSICCKDHLEAAVGFINRGRSDGSRALKERGRSFAQKVTRLMFMACHLALLVAASAAGSGVAEGRKGRVLPRGLCRWRSGHRGLPPQSRGMRKLPAVMSGPQPREPQRRLHLSTDREIPILARSIGAGRFSRHQIAHRSCRSKFQPKAISDKWASAPEKRSGPVSVRPCGGILEIATLALEKLTWLISCGK